MEQKDELKDILRTLNQLHAPIDLETRIISSIQKQENLKAQAERYMTQGIRALIVSFLLLVILIISFYFEASTSFQDRTLKYASIIISLLVLFIQLELAGLTYYLKNTNENRKAFGQQ